MTIETQEKPGFYVYLEQYDEGGDDIFTYLGDPEGTGTWGWWMEEIGDFTSDTVYNLENKCLGARTRADALEDAKKWAERLNIKIDERTIQEEKPRFVLYTHASKDIGKESWCWYMRELDDMENGLIFRAPCLYKDTEEEAIVHAKLWGSQRDIEVLTREELDKMRDENNLD